MKLLTQYMKQQENIYSYFGYKEDWVAIPLNDSTEMIWGIIGGEGHGGSVRFAPTDEIFDSEGDYYENEIYTQRFLPKWVYRGAEYTMICVDTHTDGNKFLQIFANDKERKFEEIQMIEKQIMNNFCTDRLGGQDEN